MGTYFIMMCGLPGSGKSTIAKLLFTPNCELVIHSSDDLREEMYGDTSIQGDNKALFAELHRRMHTDLVAGKTVIYDATNLTVATRKQALDAIRDIDCKKLAFVVTTPLDECIARNNARARVVPEDVIRRMASYFSVPTKDEGFDDVVNDVFEVLKDFKTEFPTEYEYFYCVLAEPLRNLKKTLLFICFLSDEGVSRLVAQYLLFIEGNFDMASLEDSVSSFLNAAKDDMSYEELLRTVLNVEKIKWRFIQKDEKISVCDAFESLFI